MPTPMIFADWCKELIVELASYNATRWTGSAMVDAAVPYEMGYSPSEAAAAYVGQDSKRLSEMVDEAKRRDSHGKPE